MPSKSFKAASDQLQWTHYPINCAPLHIRPEVALSDLVGLEECQTSNHIPANEHVALLLMCNTTDFKDLLEGGN